MRSTKPILAGLLAIVRCDSATRPRQIRRCRSVAENRRATGKPVIWFLFVENHGTYQGVAAKLFPRAEEIGPQSPVCTACPDDRRNMPMLGLPIIRDMKRNGAALRERQHYGSARRPDLSRRDDGKPRWADTHRARLSRLRASGRNEVRYRLPDDAIKHLDHGVVAKYLPNQAQGRAQGQTQAQTQGQADVATTSALRRTQTTDGPKLKHDPKSGPGSRKHALGLDPRDHAQRMILPDRRIEKSARLVNETRALRF